MKSIVIGITVQRLCTPAAARAEPRNADVHNLLGYTWRKRATPDITKAFEHYYTALRLDPRQKGAHEYIGQAYLMEKRPEEANKHLAQLESICGNKTCISISPCTTRVCGGGSCGKFSIYTKLQ